MNDLINKVPWMHKDEIKIVEKYLSKNTVMLEWGCGGSTIYFSEKVKHLFSIEHNKEWFDSINAIKPANVTLVYSAANNLVPITESTYNDYSDYIEIASSFNKKFDVVLIDGRARVECAIKALDLIHRNSVVIVHDFYKKSRDRYKKVLNYYDLKESVDYTKQGLAIFTPKVDFNRGITELQSLILRAAENKKPLSVLRLSDGEYFAAKSIESHEPINDIPFIKHLGFVPPEFHKKEISANILESAQKADLLCLPEYPGGKWKTTRNYFLEKTGRIYFFPADIHIPWLANDFFSVLFSKFDKVLLITGHNLANRLKKRYPHLEVVEQILIPRQPRYFKEFKVHYPDEFKKTISAINAKNLNGYLCLTGAGFIGKPYVIKCAERGAVAVDIGSVFDRWAGYLTRGKGKGFETENLKYKL
jgi:hypothetical protein